MDKNELRPITFLPFNTREEERKDGYWIGLSQCSSEDGTDTYAIVENLDGNVQECNISQVQFTDREEPKCATEQLGTKEERTEALSHAIHALRNTRGGFGFRIDVLRAIREEIQDA